MKFTRPFPVLSSGICLIGTLFCLWVLRTGGESLCLTDGCSLFQDFRIAGISLWQAGSTVFLAMLLLCLVRLVSAAYLSASLALIADILLLGVMLFTAPCVNCLIVGLLLALTYTALRHDKKKSAENSARQIPQRHSCLVMLWLLLFLFNLGGVLRDLPELWSPLPRMQQGTQQASVQVFFSPSCRACGELIQRADRLPDARWFPVPEDERDIWVIHAMTAQLAQGDSLPSAVEKAQKSIPPLPDFLDRKEYTLGLLRPDMLMLRFRLWKNRAHVLAAGSNRIPFVEFLGLPSFILSDSTGKSRTQSPSSLPEIPELQVAGFCGGDGETPCNSPEESQRPVIDTSGMTP